MMGDVMTVLCCDNYKLCLTFPNAIFLIKNLSVHNDKIVHALLD